MTKRILQRKGYIIKHTDAVGWWVDGTFGYLVAGYFDTEAKAIEEASKAIDLARSAGTRPVWMI